MSIKQLAEDNLKDITEQIIQDMESHKDSLRSACKYASQSFFFVRDKAEVKVIVGFPAHGAAKRKASAVAEAA